MKMPRSQCEAENVHFVQELAEIDGPFESPININFRDLTKLELPALVWNRGDLCPKKMKITNTGHTVIISAKWKSERPFLTGGPLSGKYVFSQIHFHWGQDDCKGSEHLVSGDGFPLEMHVAHFKTEYLTQECALREKDGMVVVVYLFKLQDEPNQSLKKIISLLPCVKQASTSHAIDPRPILTICNPFSDDYFMYWGSVVTSTCAHILLWLICREPFGISKDQVNEFRKIMDSGQQPVCRNSRDIQPLHRRNVFHVNASKYRDNPLLPVKNMLGCYCQEVEDTTATEPQSQDCKCETTLQEEVEGSIIEYSCGNRCLHTGGVKAMHMNAGLPCGCYDNQTFVVQRATVQSVSLLVKRFGSEPVRNYHRLENSKQLKLIDRDQSKLLSKSCCFYPLNASVSIKAEKRKTRGKRPFNSSTKAFSQIMHSLEVLKNHTFKKLREIESINQEIKGMKYFCQDNEDRKWLRRLERLTSRQKRFTIKSSQGCLSELRKLARDCNFDKVFDCTALPGNENNRKILWLNNNEMTQQNLTINLKPKEIPAKESLSSKQNNVGKAIKFSAKAQKLIQSFFEDIHESDDFHETMKKDLSLKKIKGFCSKQAGDSNSVTSVIKGYITKNMFVLGNLGDRFFTEVTTEDFESDENQWKDAKGSEKSLTSKEIIETQDITDNYEVEKAEETGDRNLENHPEPNPGAKNEVLIPLQGAKVGAAHQKTPAEPNNPEQHDFNDDEMVTSDLETLSDVESTSREKRRQKSHPKKKSVKFYSKFVCKERNSYESINNKLMRETKEEPARVHRSSSTLSTESSETHRMIITKFRRRRSRKMSWEQDSSEPCSKCYPSLYEKINCKELKGCYCICKGIRKGKNTRRQKGEKFKENCSSSTPREDSKVTINISKLKNLRTDKFKIETEKSDDLINSSIENSMISPRRKKLKLEIQKELSCTSKENYQMSSTDAETQGEYTENDLDGAIKNNLEESSNSKLLENSLSEGLQRMISNTVSSALRASSVNSGTSIREKKETNELDEFPLDFQKGNKTLMTAILKPAFKSKSLISVIPTPRIAMDITQRLCLESLDERRKTNREIFEPHSAIKFEKKSKIKRDLSNVTFVKTYDSDEEPSHGDTKRKDSDISETQTKLNYDVAFFTKTSGVVDEKLLPKSSAPEVKVKHTGLKRCDAEKYQFLETGSQELIESNDELILTFETLQQTDSRKSLTKDASKDDANPANVLNNDLQISVSSLKLKKSSPSRPHSAETRNSLTKVFKKKRKNCHRCCKRISRSFMRKNSSVVKKPNKAENKSLNFLNLTDQEQLQIISVNVAKYLKQHLVEENDGLDPKKTCGINDVKQAVLTKLKDTQEKKEETPHQPMSVIKEEKIQQNKIPAPKARERKEENLAISKSNRFQKGMKTPSERKNEKPVCALPKPVNNFVKLNKLMAGKYKKTLVPVPEQKVLPKEKPKPSPETPAKVENMKFKTRIPKKRVEKVPVHKVHEPPAVRLDTPSSPKSLKLSPKKKTNNESRIKSPLVPIKKDPKNNETVATNKKKLQELMMCDQNSNETLGTLQTFQAQKTPFVPSYTLTTILPTPIEIVDNKTRKLNRWITGVDNCLPEVLFDNKGVDGNEALFRKELEYFIKLEMHLNKEIPANLDNPMSVNFVKSTSQGQDSYGSNFLDKKSTNDPLQFDSLNKEIVLLKMKDMDCSSSGSDFVEDADKFPLIRSANCYRNEDFDKSKEIATVKIPKESGDLNIVTPMTLPEKQEETNSDSSYDCKISITLNTNFNVESENDEKETEGKAQNSPERYGKTPRYDPLSSRAENINSQNYLGKNLEENSSQLLFKKQHRRKRKDNELSLEMKNKLLEILEGEILREIGIKSSSSPDTSSEGLTFKWDDSDGNNKSQSTGSSSDNIEMLTHISETVRQYLKTLKEGGQLVEIIEPSDKES